MHGISFSAAGVGEPQGGTQEHSQAGGPVYVNFWLRAQCDN